MQKWANALGHGDGAPFRPPPPQTVDEAGDHEDVGLGCGLIWKDLFGLMSNVRLMLKMGPWSLRFCGRKTHVHLEANFFFCIFEKKLLGRH